MYTDSGVWWTISPIYNLFTNRVIVVYFTNTLGYDTYYYVSHDLGGVRPALYLSSNIILSKTGSSSAPFVILPD